MSVTMFSTIRNKELLVDHLAHLDHDLYDVNV